VIPVGSPRSSLVEKFPSVQTTRGWISSARKPVANRDLWEPLIDLVEARGEVGFRWVKGHSGDPMNDLVDRLAVEASHQVP